MSHLLNLSLNIILLTGIGICIFFCCSEYELKLSIAGCVPSVFIMVCISWWLPVVVAGAGVWAGPSPRCDLFSLSVSCDGSGWHNRLLADPLVNGYLVIRCLVLFNILGILFGLFAVCIFAYRTNKKKLTFTCCVPLQKQP